LNLLIGPTFKLVMTNEFRKKSSTVSTFSEEEGAELEAGIKDAKRPSLTRVSMVGLEDIPNAETGSEEKRGGGEVSSSAQPSACSAAWTAALVKIRRPISTTVCWMSDTAVRHPKATIIIGVVSAFVLAAIGVFTNFYIEVDGDILWTPTPSRVLSHGEYLRDETVFPSPPRFSLLQVHANGQNVLGDPEAGIRRVFQVLETVSNIDGYDDLCKEATVSMLDEQGEKTCSISSITGFFNYSIDSFEEEVQNGSDLLDLVSQSTYPDRTPVQETGILGNAKRIDNNNKIVSAETFVLSIAFPEIDSALDFEDETLDKIIALQEQWVNEPGNIYRVEIFTQRSFDDEFERAIVNDIPLVPLIFVVMSMFTGLVFFRKSWVHSRVILGVGAVCTVFLSIIFGFGIMFIIGVPFTSMTQLVPFIMFGIGMDDAFIIWGAYERMDRSIPVHDRIHDTMEEVGVSIFMTTLTSVVAFSLGSLSVVPAVYWLCAYAAPTIFIDFVYQITFFVALIVLDERRVEERRRDCFTCMAAPGKADDEEDEAPEGTIVDRFMSWYSNMLMKPVVKLAMLAMFFAMFGALGHSALLLKQEFYFTDVLPSDSYVADFWDAFTDYTGGSGVDPFIVFRNVDQGDVSVQMQMEEYVNQIVNMDEVGGQPDFFWVRDFQTFVKSNLPMAELAATFPQDSKAHATYLNSTTTVAQAMTNLSFESQLDAFLTVPAYDQLYSNDIVRNSNGNVTASRTKIRMSEVDQRSVEEQVDALEKQRVISEALPINANVDPDDWNFFTFHNLYYIWQFYTESPSELVLTTILGVSAVSVISLIFIPHWSSIFFVAPIISILYVDLLGFLQLCGVAINAVSYIALVMSIGLMVDFLLHILLRFFESKETTREAKVKDVLQTMGVSILIGGISTFLGVLPLAFSTSTIFSTIFYCFLGLVVLGITHGLIFLPVILSLCGPEVVLDL
jgi:Niemann-Pick C1 protein